MVCVLGVPAARGGELELDLNESFLVLRESFWVGISE
jgi:hypothetical protein